MRTNVPAPPHIDGYRPVRYLGSGGFGDVFHYQHTATSAAVAIKVLRAGLLAANGTTALLHEAKALGRLSTTGAHPNIVTVQDVGNAAGRPFLIMEYCPAGSWAEHIDRAGRLHPATVLSVGIQIAGALSMAHEAGIVHRDIKPGNILLGANVGGQNIAKLADFGIAAWTEEDKGRASAWLSYDYAAPEVWETGVADQLSDLFSLAATLYHALAGRSWVSSVDGDNSPDARAKRIHSGHIPPIGADVPESLEWLLRAAMAMDRRVREATVPNALEFALRLRDIQFEMHYERTPVPVDRPVPPMSHGPVPAPRSEPVRGDGRRHRRIPLVAATAILLAVAGVGAALLAGREKAEPKTAPPVDASIVTSRRAVPVPAVTGRRLDADRVEFTWTYADAMAGDTFRVRSGNAPSVSTDMPQWIVNDAVGEVCVEVSVVRADGRTTAAGGRACV